MQRDLFKAAFEEFSRFDWATYEREFLDHMPRHLLRSAIKAHSFEGSQLERSERILCLLESAEAGRWNNPELYPSLFQLTRADADRDRALKCLELQLGCADLCPAHFEAGFYRQGGSRCRVRRIVDGRVVDLSGATVWRLEDSDFPTFYLPHPHLFDDVVGGVYIGAGDIDRSDLEEAVRGAQSALRRYSAELHDGFCDAVGCVALVGMQAGLDRSSYSARMRYAGGIFSSFRPNNVPALLENIVHEYYHQRLWVWWSIEAPGDLPPEGVTIVSPITHLDRSVQVMIHALMIYVGVAGLYAYCLDSLALAPTTREWAERRLARIEEGIRTLPSSLRERLGDCPKTLGFVNFLADLHPR